MTDVHAPEVRSYNMSCVKGQNTKPEIIVRKFLFSNGFRYRLYDKSLPGRPDIVLKKYRTAIFINGCFWHGHTGCKYYVIPKTRTTWWLSKITKNKEKDAENVLALMDRRWKVITVWECELSKGNAQKTLKQLSDTLVSISEES